MTLTAEEARACLGRAVQDSRGDHLGEVDGVYFNDATGDLEWLSFSANFLQSGRGFFPVGDLTSNTPGTAGTSGSDRVTLTFDRSTLEGMPTIEPQGGVLSNAQVARLHEFFGTFDGSTRVTTATEGGPTPAGAAEGDSGGFSGRAAESAFGTGVPGPKEPHDVTLQGTGNPAP